MITISEEHFGMLCICSLRYCQGRRTYMPSVIQRIVGNHLKEIRNSDLKIMMDECLFQRRMNLYGDDCDRVDWLKWEQKVMDEIKRREEE